MVRPKLTVPPYPLSKSDYSESPVHKLAGIREIMVITKCALKIMEKTAILTATASRNVKK
jgi:hypothetical protein